MHMSAKVTGVGQVSPMRGTFLVATGLAALCAPPAQADVTGHYAYSTTDRNLGPPVDLSMTVEVRDGGDFRLQLPGVPYYVLSLSGQLYLVKSAEGSVQVMRVEDVDALLVENARKQGTDELLTSLKELEAQFPWKKIGPVNQAGWDGVAFGLSADADLAQVPPLLVVSNDSRLQPLARPFLEVQSERYGAFGRALTIIPLGSKPVFERGAPLQIMMLKLVRAEFAPIDPSRFGLPGEPMSLDEVRSSGALFPNPEAPAGDDE